MMRRIRWALGSPYPFEPSLLPDVVVFFSDALAYTKT
jgi:hypothetical protein